MSPDFFRFKQFSVNHQHCAMKVGTDGVLLGAWVNADMKTRALDIGTGSGVIALMIAQKSEAVVDAVEIDRPSANQAGENFSNSPWPERLNIFASSFRDFYKKTRLKYDLIVCNPPFFLNSLKSADAGKRLAKHNDNLSFEELVNGVRELLSENGNFYLILPPAEMKIFRNEAMQASLWVNGELLIRPRSLKPVNRIIISFGHKQTSPTSQEICLRDADGNFTMEYINLTKDYYLNF